MSHTKSGGSRPGAAKAVGSSSQSMSSSSSHRGSSVSRLDSILDEALDEFEEKDIKSKISKMKISVLVFATDLVVSS